MPSDHMTVLGHEEPSPLARWHGRSPSTIGHNRCAGEGRVARMQPVSTKVSTRHPTGSRKGPNAPSAEAKVSLRGVALGGPTVGHLGEFETSPKVRIKMARMIDQTATMSGAGLPALTKHSVPWKNAVPLVCG